MRWETDDVDSAAHRKFLLRLTGLCGICTDESYGKEQEMQNRFFLGNGCPLHLTDKTVKGEINSALYNMQSVGPPLLPGSKLVLCLQLEEKVPDYNSFQSTFVFLYLQN